MVKLKASSKLQKSSKESRGKHKRSANSDIIGGKNDCIVDKTNGDTSTVLKKKKSKSVNVEDVDECCNEEKSINRSASDEHNTASAFANPGWADAMQKILKTKKPKKKKNIVLSKAKKLQDIKPKVEEDNLIEVDKPENKPAQEILKSIEPADESQDHVKSKRKDACLGIRVKPSVADRERERMLQKIATKGVVQLFNAVKQQQTEISKRLSEAGPLERKREKVLKDIDKNTFLDVLMGGAKSFPVERLIEPKVQQNDETDDKMWSVLRDDFVMGAKLKDWDKKSDSGTESSSAPEDMDSDDGAE